MEKKTSRCKKVNCVWPWVLQEIPFWIKFVPHQFVQWWKTSPDMAPCPTWFHIPNSDLPSHARQQWGEQPGPTGQHAGGNWRWGVGLNFTWFNMGFNTFCPPHIPITCLLSSPPHILIRSDMIQWFDMGFNTFSPPHIPITCLLSSWGFKYEQSNANRSSCMPGQRLAIAQI